MPKQIHTQRRYRTQFRRLAFGEPFWFATNLATAPNIKQGRTTYLSGWNPSPDGSSIQTTVADVSIAVVRVPGRFSGQNRVLS